MTSTPYSRSVRSYKSLFMSSMLAVILSLAYTSTTLAADPAGARQDAGLTSLITDTPEAGFALAVKLSQKAVAATQTDAEARKELRPAYAHDPNSLIAVSHVVATHFQTIAAANNYWRE